jgi:hypothetical protein
MMHVLPNATTPMARVTWADVETVKTGFVDLLVLRIMSSNGAVGRQGRGCNAKCCHDE